MVEIVNNRGLILIFSPKAFSSVKVVGGGVGLPRPYPGPDHIDLRLVCGEVHRIRLEHFPVEINGTRWDAPKGYAGYGDTWGEEDTKATRPFLKRVARDIADECCR